MVLLLLLSIQIGLAQEMPFFRADKASCSAVKALVKSGELRGKTSFELDGIRKRFFIDLYREIETVQTTAPEELARTLSFCDF